MKKQFGITSLELLTSLSIIAASYGLTLTISDELQKQVDKYVVIHNSYNAQLCKFRPSLCNYEKSN